MIADSNEAKDPAGSVVALFLVEGLHCELQDATNINCVKSLTTLKMS